jgi:hypothetical protein
VRLDTSSPSVSTIMTRPAFGSSASARDPSDTASYSAVPCFRSTASDSSAASVSIVAVENPVSRTACFPKPINITLSAGGFEAMNDRAAEIAF